MAPTSSAFLVEIDGTPLPADVEGAAGRPRTSTTASGCPTLFVLRFRDPDRIVLAKSGAKIGSKVKVVGGQPTAAPARSR